MDAQEIGTAIGIAVVALGAFITHWRTYGFRWKPVTNGNLALQTRVTTLEKENIRLERKLDKCNQDRNDLRKLVTDAVRQELGERHAPNPQGSG